MSDLTALWQGLLAMADHADAERARVRAERRARPEAIARRQEAARRGWETRRARREADAEDPRYDGGPGPTCDEMTHDSIGSEVVCALDPGHEGQCDDRNGCQWDAS